MLQIATGLGARTSGDAACTCAIPAPKPFSNSYAAG